MSLSMGVGDIGNQLAKVTRVEVIDHRTDAKESGRVYTAWNCVPSFSFQDNGRTLKIFIDDKFASHGGVTP